MSLWDDIFCAITFERLHAYQITHTLAFAAAPALRHAYEVISGLHLDSMHVEMRLNKLILSLGIHVLDTEHTLLRFPIFIRPDGKPVLSPRVSSIIDWNTSNEPAERRNGFAELPPMGPDSPGILYWALQLDTDLDFVTHYNPDGLNPYHSPIKYGSFYYSNEDPFAVIGNTAHNMDELQQHNRLNYQHLCPWAQEIIDTFLQSHFVTITGGTLDEDHIKYYAALPLPPMSDDDEEQDEPPQPPPTYAVDSPESSTAPEPPTPSNYTPSFNGSDSESDDPTPRSSPSPQVRLKATRAMTQDDRKHGAKVKKALQEERLTRVDEFNERIEREKEEQELRGEDSESDTEEQMQERARAKDRARMERIKESLLRDQKKHDFYSLMRCTEMNEKEDLEPARFKMLQDSRLHKRSYVAAAKRHFHVTRSKTKAIRSELAPLEGEPSYQEWVDGWKANRRYPRLPRLEELSVVDMAPPPEPKSKSKDSGETGTSGPASTSTAIPAPPTLSSTNNNAIPAPPASSLNSTTIPAPPVASEFDDTIPDTSDMPTPRVRTRDLETLVTPSGEDELDADEGTVGPPSELAPIAGPSRQHETETVPSSDTDTQNLTSFTFTHSHAQPSAGPSQPASAF
ncbi:hypothetical protein CYLTODRAFT_474149 [Cylindrobasidium torrendii FP15055 ss-10]|uniref:Uncharacterized protein n=1 Tax=Cylindrobasidium torrendii FP15055 ss-10 TaxID=1314674 RepID=A0A0D7AXI8_9AGAR|nr:hypothetical protein CYLTODRAFT_474149 [Cylindrobasidium torrendii FP15055 ss-10]